MEPQSIAMSDIENIRMYLSYSKTEHNIHEIWEYNNTAEEVLFEHHKSEAGGGQKRER